MLNYSKVPQLVPRVFVPDAGSEPKLLTAVSPYAVPTRRPTPSGCMVQHASSQSVLYLLDFVLAVAGVWGFPGTFYLFLP